MDLKLKDVADLLNVSEITIRRWLADGKIPAYRINHQYRFNREEIENWVLSHKLGHGHTPHNEQPNQGTPRATKGGIKQFSLYRAIHKGGVLHNVPGNTKEDVIRNSMRILAKELNLDAEVLAELLLDRENIQSTALNNGIGIPHTRDFLLSAHFDAVTIVFPEKPIAYGSLDGKPVHTLFFLFACDDKMHLHLLAKIAHLSSQNDTINFLTSHPPKEAVFDYIKQWESPLNDN